MKLVAMVLSRGEEMRERNGGGKPNQGKLKA
jgi:hypothetical protein